MLDQKLRILLMQLIMKALNHFEEVEWTTVFLKRKVSKKMTAEIEEFYVLLSRQYGQEMTDVVRSSATAEDLPDASFAGQQETFLT
jgi:phosphoenolpyruvate synthase/pyruvate phosphate dikinase